MGLTLKIGAGVFVGGLALFLVINAPAWIHQSLRDSWNEQALEIMNRLTPDIVIQRCGKPNRDFLQAGQRWLVYDGRLVALDFVSEKDSWTFGLMYEGGLDRNGLPDGDWITGESPGDEAFKQIAMLSCLEPKQH
jgi:hypothetical protein